MPQSDPTYAAQTLGMELASQSLQYQEQVDGQVFIEEQGRINQISIQHETNLAHHWQLVLRGRAASGKLDYDGQTLLGMPLETRTDHQFASLAAKISHQFSTVGFDLIPYLQIATHHWSRRVLATEDTHQVEITRRWWEPGIGLVLQKSLQAGWNLELETYYGVSIEGNVNFDYTSLGFVKKSADSNQGEFFHAGLRLEKQFQSHWRLTSGYRMHRSRWDRSDTVVFDNPISLSLFEPVNRLKTSELFLGIARDFH